MFRKALSNLFTMITTGVTSLVALCSVTAIVSVLYGSALLGTVVTTTGCQDLIKPKSSFLGIEKNLTQWLLFAAQPSDVTKTHRMDPGVYFQDYLEGSRVYHFESHYPDNTTYASFDMRINNVSGDSRINDVNVDWYVAWGAGAAACVTPINGDDEAAVRNITIEVTNFRTQVGTTPSTMGMTPPAPMTVMLVSRSEMNEIKTTMSNPSLSRVQKIAAFNTHRVRHGLAPVTEEM